jgi:predicted ATPase
MLDRLYLENFKASRDLDVRLTPLTVLTGLNSSGKSTLLQAICALRQSYDFNGRTEGPSLSGDLVQLGKYGDLLSEGSLTDTVSVTITEDGTACKWAIEGPPRLPRLRFAQVPELLPNFLTSRDFQFLQADRIVPQTLYPQAPQRAKDTGFLGPRGEFTADFLSTAALRQLKVPTARTFPRKGLGLNESLLLKVAPTDSLLDQVSGWIQQLSPGASLRAEAISGTDEVLLQFRYDGRKEETSSNLYRPTNVGFGLTYSLPIIVACLAAPRGALLLLENPEAHLHPQGQAALGDLIARCANDGVQIVVETHSDHLLNGVRLAVKGNLIDPEKVVFHFFTREVETGDAFVQSPAIFKNGRLSNWPEGFFDQWDKDVDALLE